MNKEKLIFIPNTTVTIPMIYVKGGDFLMGSDKGYYEEKPIHSVNLDGFWIGKYPITQAQWYAVVTQATAQSLPHNLNPVPSYFKNPENPVEQVSWIDCMTWIDLLQNLKSVQNENSYLDLNFNLPTEAQWEYVAQGGIYELQKVGWYADNSNNTSHAVGFLKPNELGVYDMSGNLWEWCLDKSNELIYEYIPPNSKNPLLLLDQTVIIIDSNTVNYNIDTYIKTRGNDYCVMRGGSWEDIAYDCRLTLRNLAPSNNSDYYSGFSLFGKV